VESARGASQYVSDWPLVHRSKRCPPSASVAAGVPSAQSFLPYRHSPACPASLHNRCSVAGLWGRPLPDLGNLGVVRASLNVALNQSRIPCNSGARTFNGCAGCNSVPSWRIARTVRGKEPVKDQPVNHPLFARLWERIIAPASVSRGADGHRRRLLRSLGGRVIEVGAGHGTNFPYYPTWVHARSCKRTSENLPSTHASGE
jgi:hypothetical protein